MGREVKAGQRMVGIPAPYETCKVGRGHSRGIALSTQFYGWLLSGNDDKGLPFAHVCRPMNGRSCPTCIHSGCSVGDWACLYCSQGSLAVLRSLQSKLEDLRP